ncbi:MAG: hypothetical protein IKO16_01690 [Lachnospiraceae bacterium]|nr:hypothetical protein [Lachnospiraceae bacterium]
MKKAMISVIAVLLAITAAGFGALYLSGRDTADKAPQKKTEDASPDKNKLSDDTKKFLEGSTEKKTSQEILNEIRSIDSQTPQAAATEERPDITPEPTIEERPDIKPEPTVEERPDIKPEPTVEEKPDPDPKEAGENEKNEISREDYETCGYDSGYVLIKYADGTTEIVQKDAGDQ